MREFIFFGVLFKKQSQIFGTKPQCTKTLWDIMTYSLLCIASSEDVFCTWTIEGKIKRGFERRNI